MNSGSRPDSEDSNIAGEGVDPEPESVELALPPPMDENRITLEFDVVALGFEEDTSPPQPLKPQAMLDTPKVDEPDALSLVDSRSALPAVDLRAEMNERFALDDFTAALSLAELLLGKDEGDAESQRIADRCRERLIQIRITRLGSWDSVPRMAVPLEEVRWLGIDHRGGFLLSCVDGAHSIEQICDISSMPRLEVLKTLGSLLDNGAIRFDS